MAAEPMLLEAQDKVQQFFTAALSGLPWPVSQPPGDADAETYITFQEIGGSLYQASGTPTRVRHMVQLHAFTHSADDAHRTAFFAALDRLKAAGVRVYSWGLDDYEKDTGIHHIACTCVWWQRPGSQDSHGVPDSNAVT